MAQRAIERADEGDFEGVKITRFFLLEIVMCNLNLLCLKVRQLLRVLRRPFDRQDEAEEAGFPQRPPLWAREVRVSCSS